MTDEEYVRSVWEKVTENEYDPHEGYSIPQTRIEFGPHRRLARKRDTAWAESATFTRDWLESLRKLREEIAWLESESSMSDGYPYPAAVRILARLESALATMTQGMKPDVQP